MRVTAGVVLLALALTGCAQPVRIDPPRPQGAAAEGCRALGNVLPQRLDGAERAEATPRSPYTAVWGEAEIALRCGVPRPAAMKPTDTVSEFNGVAWFADPAKPLLFTAIGREAYVEVTISREHTPGDVLVELAGPITKAIPD
ncbi:DUF3515 domain-containing protein [Thermopolyspora sp. NPDC052614]|uniref:DUF3515 domain-containing protein n=1 Tax=Thermopolyspora sp. NPDC052614 TaxID=3155682 RepID=UPI003439A027